MEDFILKVMDHVYPGLRNDFWPGNAAGFVSEGEGVVVTYSNDRFQAATIVLSGLKLSTELIQGLRDVNAGLPIGSVFLSDAEVGWCAVWKYKLLGDWLDPASDVSRQMLIDILVNAPNMTALAREMLQAKECGGASTHPVDPESGYGLITMSHV